MKRKIDPDPNAFYPVGLALVFAGAVILAIGLVFWGFNAFQNYHFVSPSNKVIGGLVVMGLGYVVIELECIRHKVR